MREDENGYLWNIIAGGIVGGIIELGTQLIANGGDFSDISWGKVALSTFTGALTAAVGPLAGTIISGASSVGMDAIDGNIDSLDDAITSFFMGTASALASYGIGTAVGKATKSLTKIEKISRIADKGQKGYFGVKYSYNKGSGRAIISVEIHGNHNNHGIHFQVGQVPIKEYACGDML